MEENYLIKKIEELNLEIIDLKESNEYLKGKTVIKFTNLIKKFKFITLFKAINKKIRKRKLKNYIDYEATENDFVTNLDMNNKPKIVIYTCITGGYDKLISPFLKLENIDYVAFSDNKEDKNEDWTIREIPENIKELKNNILINRYLKFHPYELFEKEGYDYAIYIDGNIKVVSDFTDMTYAVNEKTGLAMHRHYLRDDISNEIETCRILKKGNYKKLKEQVNRYKSEGFPDDFGMLECNLIVSNLKNKKGQVLLDNWWEEFKTSESYRDQIALPYVIWKQGYKIEDVGNLGKNIRKNGKLRIILHTND